MIGIVKLLTASKVGISTESLKVHLAGWDGHEHPIDVYLAGRFEAWQSRQNKKNFGCSQVLSLISLGYGNWLFAGIYKVEGCEGHPEFDREYLYRLSLLPGQEDLTGRVIVHHQRKDRRSYVWYNAKKHPFPIAEIRREKMTIEDFPGYCNVLISFARLRIITDQKLATWHVALANAQGIYLITDTVTGKHYVGKASGSERLWQRWCDYARTGHGGNVQLRMLLEEHGIEHAQHFQYSILEVLDHNALEDEVLRRENHWMNILKTREFGLN